MAALILGTVIGFGTGPTFAAGLLSDRIRAFHSFSPDLSEGGTPLDRANEAAAASAKELDLAHKNLDAAVNAPVTIEQDRHIIGQQSKTCLTPRQVCVLPKSTLRGTTCFCDTDDFGRAQ
jgi:hypothetical protein